MSIPIDPLDLVALREELLLRIETVRSRNYAAVEYKQSINEWIGRIQGHAREAHSLARAGEITLEAEEWEQIAAIAVARLEQLRLIQDGLLVNEFEPEPPEVDLS